MQAPNIENYYIGKGKISFKAVGESLYRDLGNVTTFELTPNLTKLDHFSSREGVKKKDRAVVTEKAMTVRIVTDEWDTENVRLALLGGETEIDSDGRTIFEIFKSNAVTGALRFEGTNEVGPKFQYDLPTVEFIPQNAVNPLSEEWGTLELQGDVTAATGSFGTVTLLGEEASSV